MTFEIEIKLDFRDKRPISAQLQEEMRRLILEGALAPGAQLPTVRGLAAHLQVNFNTVARAYRILDQEGLISTRQGRGTYVLEEAISLTPVSEADREERLDILFGELFEKAARLHISPEMLQDTFTRRMKTEKARKSTIPQRKIRRTQKKRRVTPTLANFLFATDIQNANRKHRRKRSRM
jgi:GntR family transcriptional regulator